MPALPVIADTYRVAMLWASASGLRPVNVMHFRSATGTASQLGTALRAHITSTMFGGTSNLFTQDAFDILKLDGTSATVAEAGSNVVGQDTSSMIPGVAVVISLKTAQRGSRGRGRLYLGPIGETTNSVNGGRLLTADATTIVNAWGAFHAAMVANTPSFVPVVASYVHADAHDITSIRCDIPFGTQRRRQDRIAGR